MRLNNVKKIIFTGDFTRTDQILRFEQKRNIKKILKIIRSCIGKITSLPICFFPDVDRKEYKNFVRALYEMFGLTPSLESWAAIYHIFCLKKYPQVVKRMFSFFQNEFQNAIVISF